MMIGKRILQKRAWSSGPHLLCLYSPITLPPPPLPAAEVPESSLKHPFAVTDFSSRLTSCSGYASASFSSTNNFINFVNRCWFSSLAWANLPVGGVVDVELAQTGEGIAECELLKWFVQEGDEIEEFQPLCEVQSDKATIEITSRYKGKVAEVLFVPGDIVKVGETLLKLAVEESQIPTLTNDASQCPTGAHAHLENTESLGSDLNKGKLGGVLTTPAVRLLAKQYGINLLDVHGTGRDGRVSKEDVLKYAVQKGLLQDSVSVVSADSRDQLFAGEEGYAQTSTKVVQHHDDKTVPLRGFHRVMVETMSMAAKVPHFHYVEEINCDALVELKASFQNNNDDPSVKYSFLPFLIKSLSVALSKYPWMNSCFNKESLEVILKVSHNIGIAMATPHGLAVPNIKNVQSLSILEITKELSRLQKLALDNKLSPEDVTGGTITLSNIGAIGGKFGAPLLNLPEVSIIAMGRIQKVAQFSDDGNVYPVSAMTVNIGADHRVLDGATVARFCNEWKHLIEKPELLLVLMR